MTLGVALGVEDMAQRLQLGDQFLVVVDLAVEDHHHRAVFVEQRLLAGGDVDDGQAPVAEAQAGLDVQAAFVGPRWTARRSCGAARMSTGFAAGVEDAGDAAHGVAVPRFLDRCAPLRDPSWRSYTPW
jgi:hypothetical protein